MADLATGCLDDDEIMSFVEGDLGSERRRQVLAHVDGCESCRMLAVELAREKEEDGSPPSSSRLDAGELVSERFLLDKPLGRGAMGTVYRAHDQKLGIDVALKLLRRDPDSHHGEGFTRELRVGRKITHPNVCRLYDAGSTQHYDYITMELVDGETLGHVLAKGELPRERALDLLSQIAAGLGAAHTLGIVHRDLKPANVMIERSTGRAVLTDFGFATDLDAKQSRRLVGTPAYWAPEQARGEKATPASDVYSFGVLAYRLLAGKEFSMSDRDALAQVPRDLRRAVGKCVELRPSDRFADANEARAAFTAPKSRRTVWAIGAAAAFVAVALAWSSRETKPAPVPPPSLPAASIAPEPTPPPAASTPQPPPSAPVVEISTTPSATSAAVAHRPFVAPKPSVTAASSSPPRPAASDGDLLYRR